MLLYTPGRTWPPSALRLDFFPGKRKRAAGFPPGAFGEPVNPTVPGEITDLDFRHAGR
jgi:hypothetical protein